ncbi:DgyrCDS1919 [Dimorphilus gyrociliatus]|nr:DgyrCDS1919 [Dimorphilus gyrociliatus]
MLDKKFDWSKTKKTNMAGDDHIDIYYLMDNLMLAAWKGNDEAAFWHYLLPCHNLLDRCLKGTVDGIFSSKIVKAPRCDIDPKYGLHSYTCVIELRNQRQSILCERFRNINNSENYSESGWIAFPLINIHEPHIPLSRQLNFLWKTELFKGKIKACFI